MIKFGPSGNSIAFSSAGYKHSEESAVWVKNMGLDCFEYSFGRGVNLSDEKAESIGKAFLDAGVSISVHAPYYINFANPDADKIKNSIFYVIESAKKVIKMGGDRVIFHPASQGKDERSVAVKRTIENIRLLRDEIYAQGLENVKYFPETMGKLGQIGTVEEIAQICKVDKIFIPTIDFGHINAREQGVLKTTDDYLKILRYLIDQLGYDRMKNFHIHFSKIEYSKKGEVRHLTFEDQTYGPEFKPLATALIKLGLEPTVICESSGTQDIDAAKMKEIFKQELTNA